MSASSRVLRGTARAAVGIVVVAVAASALLLLRNSEIPAVTTQPPAVEVDTLQASTQRLVCAGSFPVIGADPSRPEAAIPAGSATVTVSGDPEETGELARTDAGEAAPTVLSALSQTTLGGAQLQRVNAETARGVAASACAAPLNEQWLLGGDSSESVSTTLNLGNPGEVPATVQISVYDENGLVGDGKSASVLVSPGTDQSVSVNGYAPSRERLAVRVISTGAPVTATLGVAQNIGIDPFGIATVTRQSEATTRLVVPGVANIDRTTESGPNDVHDHSDHSDVFAVRVRVLAPGGEAGTATVSTMSADGTQSQVGEIPLANGAIGEFAIADWPEDAQAVLIDADIDIIGGVQGAVATNGANDFAWLAPAPLLEAKIAVATPIVEDGELVIANPGDVDAEVQLISADGKEREVVIPAGAATKVDATSTGSLLSSAPVYAGVRYAEGSGIDGYPILTPADRDGVLTVYTR